MHNRVKDMWEDGNTQNELQDNKPEEHDRLRQYMRRGLVPTVPQEYQEKRDPQYKIPAHKHNLV